MSDKPSINRAPVPIRSGAASSEPPEAIVRDLRASLRATDVYVRLLLDRIELACTSDLVRLDGVPADALAQLTGASEALQGGASRALSHIDPHLARTAGAVADLMRRGANASDERQR